MTPEKMGPFRIVRVLGRGGMGAVYEGIREETGERAAVKVLLSMLEEDEELRLRFEAEINTLKRLRHPNIVRLYGFGEEQGMLYYVMELVDGPSLHQEMKQQRNFQWFEVAKIGLEMCSALRHAHDRGITHRDIKPANILLERHGIIKLSDYGIAQLFGGERLTNVNSVVGTLEYMSPEQALANPVGPRSDLYSLGAVLYALLVHTPPFSAKNLSEILRKHQQCTVPSIRATRLDVPDELESIIFDLLKVKPEERTQNAYLAAKRFQSLLQALVGPPEQILVKPMDQSTPLNPQIGLVRSAPDAKGIPIGMQRGIVVDGGVIDLGGIVNPAEEKKEDRANETDPMPIAEFSESFPRNDSSANTRPAESDRERTSLSKSFALPTAESGTRDPAESLTVATSLEPAELRETESTDFEVASNSPFAPPGSVPSPPLFDMGPFSESPSAPYFPEKTGEKTSKQNTIIPMDEMKTRSSEKQSLGQEIRHGEIVMENPVGFRRAKDEPIPEISVFEALERNRNGVFEEESFPALDDSPPSPELPKKESPYGGIGSTPDSSVLEDKPTIGGVDCLDPIPRNEADLSPSAREVSHTPYPPAPPEPALTQQVDESPTNRDSRERSTVSRFVTVSEEELDDQTPENRKRRNRKFSVLDLYESISMQTIFASLSLILIGGIAWYLLQPTPPDVLYGRIKAMLDEEEIDGSPSIISLRRAENDIKQFLIDYSSDPKAEMVLYYKEELDLGNLERQLERRKAFGTVDRAYLDAISYAKTDPEKTIAKLRAIIDLFQSDAQRFHDEETDPSVSKEPPRQDNLPEGQTVEEGKSKRKRLASPTEQYVELARRRLQKMEKEVATMNAEQMEILRRRLGDAQRLESAYPERAEEIRKAIIELYRDRHWARDIVREAEKDLRKAAP